MTRRNGRVPGARGGGLILGVIAWVLAAPAPGARGAGVRDADDGWLLAPDQAAVLLARGGSIWPGAGSWCAVATGRLYGLEPLPLTTVDCRFRLAGHWALGTVWRRVGDDPYRWDGLNLGVERTGRWRVGVRGRRETEVLGGWAPPARAALDLVAGTTVRPGGGLPLHVDVHLPLVPWPATDTRRVDPVARVGAGAGAVSLVLSWDRRGDGTPLVGAEGLFLLAPGAAVLVRADGNSGSFGPGLALGRGRLLIRSSHLVHPVLGITHRVQVAVVAGSEAGGAAR